MTWWNWKEDVEVWESSKNKPWWNEEQEDGLTPKEYCRLAVERGKDPVMVALMTIGEAVARAGFIDSVGGSEWRNHHDPALAEGTFRLNGGFGDLARMLAPLVPLTPETK
jgi:hypothetical protein